MKRAALVSVPPLTMDRRRPLAPQIAAGLRASMQTGRLKPGDRVPPTRMLALALDVSRQVIVAAYEELIASGHIDARTGDGSYVASVPRPTIEAPLRTLQDPDGKPIARPLN